MYSFLSSPDDSYKPRSSVAITAVAWAPDGSMVVSGNEAGELTLWQQAKAVATAQVSWAIRILSTRVLNWTSVGWSFACMSEGKGLCLSLKSPQLNLLRSQAPGRVSHLIWYSANSFFVLSANENVSEWQVGLRKGSTSTSSRWSEAAAAAAAHGKPHTPSILLGSVCVCFRARLWEDVSCCWLYRLFSNCIYWSPCVYVTRNWGSKVILLYTTLFVIAPMELSSLREVSQSSAFIVLTCVFGGQRTIWGNWLTLPAYGFWGSKVFFLNIYLLYLWVQCRYLQTHQKRASDPMTDGRELPCGCWELNLGPLEEQSVFLAAEPFWKLSGVGDSNPTPVPFLRGYWAPSVQETHKFVSAGKKIVLKKIALLWRLWWPTKLSSSFLSSSFVHS